MDALAFGASRRRLRLAGAVALAAAPILLIYPRFYSKTKPLAMCETTETFLELNAAENFTRCGFLRTAFLPDYSTSRDCRDRPYVYTHNPAGPAALLALFRLCGLDFPALRVPYAAAGLLGVAFMVLFCEEITGSAMAAAGSGLFAVCSMSGFFLWSDHPVHSLYWLSFFGSMYFFIGAGEGRWNRLGRLGLLMLSLATSIMWSASLVVTQALFAAILREERLWRRLRQSLALAGFFAAALILRNIIYLGPAVAFQDFWYTLTNRIWAVPSRLELSKFYRAQGIVLWGYERKESAYLGPFLRANFWNLRVPLILLPLFAGLRFKERGLKSAPVKSLAAGFGVLSWFFIFVSLGQNYTLEYLSRAWAAVLLGGSAAELLSLAGELSRGFPAAQAALAFVFMIPYASSAWEAAEFLRAPIDDGIIADPSAQMYAGLESLKAVPREAALWTNLDSPMVGRFTKAAVVGSCTEGGFRRQDPGACYEAFFDPSSETARRAQRPDFFFISSWLIPGSLLCRGNCVLNLVHDLARDHRLIAWGEFWWLLKLEGRGEPPPPMASAAKPASTAH